MYTIFELYLLQGGTALQHYLKQTWERATNTHTFMWARTRTRLVRIWNQSTLLISRWTLPTCQRPLSLPQSWVCADLCFCWTLWRSDGPKTMLYSTCLSIKRGVHLHRNSSSPSEPPLESPFLPRKWAYKVSIPNNIPLVVGRYAWRISMETFSTGSTDSG